MFASVVLLTTSCTEGSFGPNTVMSVQMFRCGKAPMSCGPSPAQCTPNRTPPGKGLMLAATMWRAAPMTRLTGMVTRGPLGTSASATVTTTYDLTLMMDQWTVQMEWSPRCRQRTRPCWGIDPPSLPGQCRVGIGALRQSLADEAEDVHLI